MSRRTHGRRRPSLLHGDTKQKFINAITAGATYDSAALAAGISRAAAHNWLKRGRTALDTHHTTGNPIPPGEQPFVDFVDELERAVAEGEVALVGSVQRVAAGGFVVRTTTRRSRDKVTGQVVEEVEEQRQGPDWRAAAFILERRHRGEWSRAERVEVSGPEGGPVEVSVGSVEETAARVLAVVAARQAELEGEVLEGEVLEGELVPVEEPASPGDGAHQSAAD